MAFNLSFTLVETLIQTVKKSHLHFVLFFLLFNSSWLHASQPYILSYRAQIKDAVVISESFYAVISMQKIHAKAAQSLQIDPKNETDLEKIIHNNKDIIIEFLMRYGTHTRSHEAVNNNKSSSLISITVPPSYITVDFKNDYAIITRLIID